MQSTPNNALNTWHHVFVLTERFNMMALNALLEPMRVANYLSHGTICSHEFCSFDGDTITSSNGMTLNCTSPQEQLERNTTIFIVASWGGESYDNKKLTAWLRRQNRSGIQICGIELGSFILARAGLLIGHKATTHWSYLPGFKECYPDINVIEQLFTESDRLLTCAGGTAGFDLMLHLIKQYRGAKLAGEVADQIMHHPMRPSETTQRITYGRGVDGLPDSISKAVRIIEENLEDPPRVGEIADAVGISQRQLERRFKANFSCSIARFSQLLRLQHARVLLVTTDLAIREIATASGFNTQTHFNQVFNRCFGRKPSAYRTGWPQGEPMPKWPGTLSNFVASVRLPPEGRRER
ncbi:GlxA family transcriptional regulator [Loktanella agnita]|uniref:GlxA family transcriptional regulator n=1 Tax=Loktanella agnita TaxID=287097 RepID=UPI003989CD89